MIYAITDIETTGGALATTKITEIAIILHDGVKIIDEFSSLVNPEKKIPPFISHLTGIKNEMVSQAPPFYEIAKKIVTFTENTVFVAHNVGFDYNVIRKEFRSLGYDYRRPHLCTVRAARCIFPGYQSYSLGKLTDQLGIQINGRHRAKGDALATSELFQLLFRSNPADLEGLVQKEINPITLNSKLNLDTIEKLPSKTGVYKLHDEERKIIYVGQSKNIKKRVIQHLKNSKSRRATKMREEVAEISYELTGSELIALLKEAELIKMHLPKFNKALKKTKFDIGLYSFYDNKGYLNLNIDRIKNKSSAPLFVFDKKANANRFLDKKYEQLQLCKNLISKYPKKGACFAYHIQICKGACIGEEPPETYNERVNQFINTFKLEDNNLFIIEKGVKKGELSIIHLKDGVYTGFGFVSKKDQLNDIGEWDKYIEHITEDRDARNIVKNYIRLNENLSIKHL